MKPNRMCVIFALILSLMLCATPLAQAGALSDKAIANTVAPETHTAAPTKPAEVEETSTPRATQQPETTAQPNATQENVTQLHDLRLNMDTLSIEIEAGERKQVRVAELELIGAGEDVSVEWFITSHSGESAEIKLEQGGSANFANVYAYPRSVGGSEYEIACYCSNSQGNIELTVKVNVMVTESSGKVPAKIEGLDLIYRVNRGEQVIIEPKNASEFPNGTKWRFVSQQSNLDVEQSGSSFKVSSKYAGRYIALVEAATPLGTRRMTHIMIMVGEQSDQPKLLLNYSELDIVLDMEGTAGNAVYFIQPSDELLYLPAEWTLGNMPEDSCASLSLSKVQSGTVLYVKPQREGSDIYELTCTIPSLNESVTLPIGVTVRRNNDDISGITLKNSEYNMRLDEAITLAPLMISELGEYPDDVKWSTNQLGNGSDRLTISVNEKTGQTTIMAYKAGVYNIEFSAELSANRIYKTFTQLTVTK